MQLCIEMALLFDISKAHWMTENKLVQKWCFIH